MGDKSVPAWVKVLGFFNPAFLQANLNDARRSALIEAAKDKKLQINDATKFEATVGVADKVAEGAPRKRHRGLKVGGLFTVVSIGLTSAVSALTGGGIVPGEQGTPPKPPRVTSSPTAPVTPSPTRTMGPTLSPTAPSRGAAAATPPATPSPPATAACALPLRKVCVQLDPDGHKTLNDAVRELVEGPVTHVLLCGRDRMGVPLRIDIRPVDMSGAADGTAAKITWFGRGSLPRTLFVTALYRCPVGIR